MAPRDRNPLNGNPIDSGTKTKERNYGKGPKVAEKSQKVQEAETRVNKAIHGLVINLLPHPTDPMQWSESVLVQALAKENIFEEILQAYLEKVMSGSVEVGGQGSKLSHEFNKKSPGKVLEDVTKSAFKDRLMETKPVKELMAAFKSLANIHGSEIKEVFVNKEWTKIFVVVGTVVAAGTAVAGLVDTTRKTKSDTGGQVVTGIANLIPKELFEVGNLKVKNWNVTGGHGGFEWTPSKGEWKASAYVEGQWKPTKDIKFNGRVEVHGSDKETKEKAKVGAMYSVGSAYLDSVEASGTGFSDGNYELMLRLNKTFDGDDDTRFEAFIGAKYKGRYYGDPDPDEQSGFSAIGGFRIRFGGK